MKGLAAVALASAVVLAVAVSAFGATPPKTSTFPTKCSQLFPLAAADRATGHTFTSIVSHYVHVKSYYGIDCFFHDADTPPVKSGGAGAVFLNHIVALSVTLRSASNAAFFAKQAKSFAAEAPARAAKDPQCQPGYVPPQGAIPPTPSWCALLHPFGSNSIEWDDFGLAVLTPKYFVDTLSGLHDPLQEPLMRMALSKLH